MIARLFKISGTLIVIYCTKTLPYSLNFNPLVRKFVSRLAKLSMFITCPYELSYFFFKNVFKNVQYFDEKYIY